MAVSAVFLVGVAVAVFVGIDVGESSTGMAFDPAMGSGVLSKRQAAALMAPFVLVGGFTAAGTSSTPSAPASFRGACFTVLCSWVSASSSATS